MPGIVVGLNGCELGCLKEPHQGLLLGLQVGGAGSVSVCGNDITSPKLCS